jgi:hypothetical protein
VKFELKLLPHILKELSGIYRMPNPGIYITLEGLACVTVLIVWAIIQLGEAFCPTVQAPLMLDKIFTFVLGTIFQKARGKAKSHLAKEQQGR